MKLKRLITEPLRFAAMGALAPFERRLLASAPPETRPVFIIGAPRSGTTLLSELLVTSARFAYFSNLAHRLYLTPVAASRLGRKTTDAWRGRLESTYGHIPGWAAPNEGGWIWRRWTPEEHRLEAGTLEPRAARDLVRTVAATSAVIGAPFLNKNVMHSVHLPLLAELFPAAVYIHLTRDTAATARSMRRARDDERNPAEWISVRPDGWERYRHEDPAFQCVAQTVLTTQTIQRDADALGLTLLRTEYESLCRDTAGQLDRLYTELADAGIRPERRALPAEPAGVRPSAPLAPADEAHLHRALRHFEESAPRLRNAAAS